MCWRCRSCQCRSQASIARVNTVLWGRSSAGGGEVQGEKRVRDILNLLNMVRRKATIRFFVLKAPFILILAGMFA